MLTDAEKIEMCRVVSDSGAEYIKTSTGFGGGGATREDVALFKAHVAPHVKIKLPAASPTSTTPVTSWPLGPTVWVPAALSRP